MPLHAQMRNIWLFCDCSFTPNVYMVFMFLMRARAEFFVFFLGGGCLMYDNKIVFPLRWLLTPCVNLSLLTVTVEVCLLLALLGASVAVQQITVIALFCPNERRTSSTLIFTLPPLRQRLSRRRHRLYKYMQRTLVWGHPHSRTARGYRGEAGRDRWEDHLPPPGLCTGTVLPALWSCRGEEKKGEEIVSWVLEIVNFFGIIKLLSRMLCSSEEQ